MKKLIIGLCAVPCALLLSTQANAVSISAQGGNDYYGVEATHIVFPGIRAGLGYHNVGRTGSNSEMYTGSLDFALPMPVIDFSVGTRYRYQSSDFGSGGGVGLGASAFIDTPIPTLSVGAFGYYTPDAFTHGDIDESYEYGVQARATLFAQTNVHVGYRYFRSDFTGFSNQTLHSGFTFGVSVGF